VAVYPLAADAMAQEAGPHAVRATRLSNLRVGGQEEVEVRSAPCSMSLTIARSLTIRSATQWDGRRHG